MRKEDGEAEMIEKLRSQTNPQVLIRHGSLGSGILYVGDFMGFEKCSHRLKIKDKKGNVNLEYPRHCYEADSHKISKLQTMRKRIREAKRKGVNEPLYYFKLKRFQANENPQG